MSGIAGIINFDGRPADRSEIARITHAMSNRGPHGIRHWVKHSVALGHCLLRTTPESLEETQPLTNENERLVLVMDGRVDNRQDLRATLLSVGSILRTRADAELVLRAFEIWGEECLSRIDGDFAIAVWDERQRRLFCARDRFGVKQFHYFLGSNFFAFATDEEAFLGLEAVPAEANEDRIACTFMPAFDGVDFQDSWLRGIKKLPPASYLFLDATGWTEPRKFWTLTPSEPNFASDAEYEEAFRALFCKALQDRRRSLSSPGLMLSGGIDSAIIAGAARAADMCGQFGDLLTFSVLSESTSGCDETTNIRRITQGHRQSAHLISAGSYETGAGRVDLKEAAWTDAHPVVNGILLPAMMYLAAARAGVDVMLDGIDGDVITDAPDRYYARLIQAGMWGQALRECRLASANHTYLRQQSPSLLWAMGCWDLIANQRVKRLKSAALRALRPVDNASHDLLDASFLERISFQQRLEAWQDEKARNRGSLSEPERHIGEIIPVGVPRGMEAFDRVAARYGVEARHPWVDRQLIEFYVGLPVRNKVRDGWTKFLVRKATSPWLDSCVRWNRNKNHLGWRLQRNLVASEHEAVLSTLRGDGGDVLEGYVDIKRMNRLLDNYKNGGLADEGLEFLSHCMGVSLWLLRLKSSRLLNRNTEKQDCDQRKIS